MDKIEIGATLRTVRKDAGKTQADMARALSTSQTTVSDWETGTNEPPMAMIYAWAAACGSGVRLVFGKDDSPETARLLTAWRRLTEQDRALLLKMIERTAEEAR